MNAVKIKNKNNTRFQRFNCFALSYLHFKRENFDSFSSVVHRKW